MKSIHRMRFSVYFEEVPSVNRLCLMNAGRAFCWAVIWCLVNWGISRLTPILMRTMLSSRHGPVSSGGEDSAGASRRSGVELIIARCFIVRLLSETISCAA